MRFLNLPRHRVEQPVTSKRMAQDSLILILLSCCLLCGSVTAAQVVDSSHAGDSASVTGVDFASRVKELSRRESEKSILDFNRQKQLLRQERLIDELQKTTIRAKAYLKHGIDTLRISRELEEINRWSLLAGDGVFSGNGVMQTSRNLVTTYKITTELLNRVNTRKVRLDTYEKELVNFRYVSDSLNADSSLYMFPEDSAVLMESLKKWLYVAKGLRPVDSSLKAAISHIRSLQAKVNFEVYELGTQIEELEDYQKELSRNFFSKDAAGLSAPMTGQRSFSQALHSSHLKGSLVLFFYVQHHKGKIILLLLLMFGAILFLRSLKSLLDKEKLIRKDFSGQLVLRYPALSGMVLSFSIFQFIFPDPPFIFNVVLWMVSSIALTVILYGVIAKYWIRYWFYMLVLFGAACYDNLILESSGLERWVMLFLALPGVVAGVFFLLGKHKKELRQKLTLWFMALAMIFEAASVLANLTGRYNLSKSLLISGYSNVIIGILFIWTIRMINEGLALASSIYTRQERKLFYLNFERVGDKAPGLLYALLAIGWFILLGRNFYEYKLISDPLRTFFVTERNIGDYTFSIDNIVIFFGIMALATVCSKVISFFASDKGPPHAAASKQRKAGLGSWLLLIRVSIISVGLFLALAASGFPLDRVTIVLGALGVGVGLGLQGLVSNLVSGLIIAFEKPVNVGDFVEISGQLGTMKSIGFRSSIVSSTNGADVVIPNGDLLNAHLINWSLGGNRRLVDLPLQVAYGSNLEQVQDLLMKILDQEEKIMKTPPPVVLFQGFGSSAIDLKIFFWVSDFRWATKVRSGIISAIDQAFREQQIIIPIPQQEIFVRQAFKKGDGPEGILPDDQR